MRLRRLYMTRGIAGDQRRYQEEGVGRRLQEPGPLLAAAQDREVLDHDFPSWAIGPGDPRTASTTWRYNDGFVVVGTSHETPSFAVAAIRRWWMEVGRWRYSGARRLLIEADGGRGQRPHASGSGRWRCNGWRTSSG